MGDAVAGRVENALSCRCPLPQIRSAEGSPEERDPVALTISTQSWPSVRPQSRSTKRRSLVSRQRRNSWLGGRRNA